MNPRLNFSRSPLVELTPREKHFVNGGAPWFVWMGVGALAVLAIDAHTDLIGELGHGCRGQNCNNLP